MIMMSQFSKMTSSLFFFNVVLFLVKFSYWSKFHVKIITGSKVMKIFFYMGFTRNPKIGNNSVWVLPNTWRLGWVMYTKFGTNVSNKILVKAAKCQCCNFYRFWVIKRKPTRGVKLPPRPTQIRVNSLTA